MKLNVFGKLLEVTRVNNAWQVFYVSNEGKKRLAGDIVIPSCLEEEAEVLAYIADVCHEWATPRANEVIRLD